MNLKQSKGSIQSTGSLIYADDTPDISRKSPKGHKRSASVPAYSKFMFSNGDRYEGHYTLHKDYPVRNGDGTHTCADGTVLQGTWDNDQLTGYGIYTAPSGSKYEGGFLNTKFHGEGIYTWPNGAKFEGSFVESRLEGEGKYYDGDGQLWIGTFHFRSALGLRPNYSSTRKKTLTDPRAAST